jgi:hypothetical protein
VQQQGEWRLVGVMTGFTRAATQPQFGHPDATLRLSGGSFAAGIGFSWGKGTLTYKGKDYPVLRRLLLALVFGLLSLSSLHAESVTPARSEAPH